MGEGSQDDLGTPGEVDQFRVVAGGPGWVAVGADDESSDVVFVSEDGLEWTRLESPTEANQHASVAGLAQPPTPTTEPPMPGVFWDYAWNEDRVVAVGRFNGIAIWLSDDSGGSWHRVDAEQDVFDFGWPLPQALGVTWFADEIIVGGNSMSDAATWVGHWAVESPSS